MYELTDKWIRLLRITQFGVLLLGKDMLTELSIPLAENSSSSHFIFKLVYAWDKCCKTDSRINDRVEGGGLYIK